MTVPLLKKEYLDMVPDFHGEPELLSRFISISEKLVNKFMNVTDPNDFQNEYLLSSLISKIKGTAAQTVHNTHISNFLDLKNALLNAYSDRRDVFTLGIELAQLKQGLNETPFEFYEKVSKLLNLQISYILNHSEYPERVILTQYCNKFALRVLLKGLREPLGSLLRTKNPEDLNSALNILTNDFQYFNSYNKPNHDQKHSPSMNPLKTRQTQFNHQGFTSKPFSQFKTPSNSQPFSQFKTPFNSQPFPQFKTPFNSQPKPQSKPQPQNNSHKFNHQPNPSPMSLGSYRNPNFKPKTEFRQNSPYNQPMEINNINDDDEPIAHPIENYDLNPDFTNDINEDTYNEDQNHFLEETEIFQNIT